ncbi:MAG: phosphoglycerate dehydrogenase [Dehalococcoidia bacterium]
MARVLVGDTLSQEGIDLLKERHDVDVQTGLSEDDLVAAVADIEGLVVRSQTQVTRRVIAAAPRLRVIGRAGVGVDNIDVDAATEHGVTVVNAPLANTISTAEHTMAMMLAVARNVPQGHASLKDGRWERSKLMGVELKGHTLGIVGLGRIGSEVARRARSFEMRLIAFDPFVTNERAATLGVEMMELDELLEHADFVTLHTTLTDGNRGMMGAAQFARMKPTARLVNCARGALVDEQALFDAVESGQIAGAAIDVFSAEPAVGNILTTSPKIVVTPHLAASTEEAQFTAAIDTAQQVIDVLDGRPGRFAVNAPLIDPDTMSVIGPYIDAAELAAHVARQLARGRIERVGIEYQGPIGTREVGPLRAAAIIGLLRGVTEERLSIVNAERVAEQHGIRIDEESGPAAEPYTNLVTVTVHATDEGDHAVRVAATHTPQGVRAVAIDEFEGVEISPNVAPYALAVENVDRPGMVGLVGTMLGQWDVNVNYMSVSGSTSEDRALMVLGIGRPLTDEEMAEVRALEAIFSAQQLDLTAG